MKFIILCLFLFFSTQILAQVDYQPNLFMSGSFSVSTSNNSSHDEFSKSKSNSKRITFQPTLGTIISDKWDLGISFKFSKSTFSSIREFMTPVASGKTERNSKFQNFDFGIFSRYHFYKNKPFSFFFQPSFFIGNSIKNTNNTTLHTFQSIVGLSLGGVIQIQKHFKLLVRFGDINYYFIGERPENGLEEPSSKFLSKILFSNLAFGVEYVF